MSYRSVNDHCNNKMDASDRAEKNRQKYELIAKNLKEVVGKDIVMECLEETGTLNVYWGTAPTGQPHVAYFLPMIKMVDFLNAECHVTILFANLHAFLDNVKTSWELIDKRTEYYETMIKGILKTLGVSLDKLRFIRGMDFQLEENYTKAVFEIIRMTSTKKAVKAGCEVVKQHDDPVLSSLVYPLLQALDEEFLGVDCQFGGVDQRKIFMYAEENLPTISFAKRAHLMNPMLPGLTGKKMSASDPNSKIDLLDTKEDVMNKLKDANVNGCTAEKNGLLAFLKYIAWPMKTKITNKFFNTYDSFDLIEKDLQENKINNGDIKQIVGEILWSLMEPLRNEFKLENKEHLIKEAYPDRERPYHEEKGNVGYKSISQFPNEHESLRKEFPEISVQSDDSFPKVTDKPRILWSCRVSGEPHIGYLIPIRKLASLSKHNWKVIILIEDIGAYLHSKHSSNRPQWNDLDHRARFYKEMCQSAFKMFGGNIDNMEVVIGSEFQLSKEYMKLMYQSLSKVTLQTCTDIIKKTGDNMVEQCQQLSSVIYPCMSVLDQLHLGPTVRLFGEEQDGDHNFAHKLSKYLGLEYRMPMYVYHEIVHSLDGKNVMSSPKFAAKVDLTSISIFDSLDVVTMKMKKAFFDMSTLETDPTFDIMEKIIWSMLEREEFCIQKTTDKGVDKYFQSVDDIKREVTKHNLPPADIKVSVTVNLFERILHPLQQSLPREYECLLSSFAFQKREQRKEIRKRGNIAVNPNKLNLRVAIVTSVNNQNGSTVIKMSSGINEYTFSKNGRCTLQQGDCHIIVVIPSRSSINGQIVGTLSHIDNRLLKLVHKPYTNTISFSNHEHVVPSLHFTDPKEQKDMIEKYLKVKGKHLIWMEDDSVANEIEFK